MLNKTRYALAFATITLVACGGGGGGNDSTAPGSTPSTAPAVAGPLDPAQDSVANMVFAPLVEATVGTPLQAVLACGNSIVTRNVLDIADAYATGLSSPSTLVSTAPAAAQGALTALVGNLSGLLGSLTGATTCFGGSAGDIAVPTTNPLAGTPLAPIGDALLPALTAASQQLTASSSGTAPQIGATQLATIVAQLSDAYSMALTQIPPEALTAPVLGGTLTSIGNSLAGLETLTTQAASGASPDVLAASFQALATGSLDDLLTLVLPVGVLQAGAGSGASTNLVTTLQAAVASLTGGLAASPTTALPANPLNAASFAVLPDIISQLTATLPAGLAGTAGTTPLAAATGPLQTLLNSLLAPITGGGCLLAILGLC